MTIKIRIPYTDVFGSSITQVQKLLIDILT